MGNCEVGHLNLGAGAVVKQDLDADRRGRRGRVAAPRTRSLREALRGRRARAPDRARLRRRRALEPRAPEGADRAGRARAACRTSSSTPSPTGATPRRTAAQASCASVERGAAEAGNARDRHRSSGATSRWTATSALGPHAEGVSTCSCTGTREHHADTATQAVRDAYERGETDEFIEPTTVGEEARIRPGRLRHRLQLPPRPDAPDHRGAIEARGVGALHDADRVRGGLAVPGRLPARRVPRRRSRRSSPSAACAQLHVAETEKYPHVTYFFNGGEEEPVPRRARASSCPRRATCRPTTTSRR